jgi:hypothetical protein
MREVLKRSLNASLALALAFAFVANGAMAQEPPVTPAPQCEAEVTPEAVPAGEAAVRVTFTLSEGIGDISGLEAPEGTLTVAAAEDIPRVDMANPNEEVRPIDLAADTNTVTVWIRTVGAEAGSVAVTLQGENDATCTASVTVQP